MRSLLYQKLKNGDCDESYLYLDHTTINDSSNFNSTPTVVKHQQNCRKLLFIQLKILELMNNFIVITKYGLPKKLIIFYLFFNFGTSLFKFKKCLLKKSFIINICLLFGFLYSFTLLI